MFIAALLASAVLAAQQRPAPYAPPRTPWGEPDLQGKWPGTDMVGVPLQRDPKLGTRNRLTEQEFSARKALYEKQALLDQADFDLDNPAAMRGGDVGGPLSAPPHWFERGRPQYQASLIVDPPDGRLPPLTPAARARAAEDRRMRQERGPADSYTDRSLYDRCISRGVAGSVLPVIYNNGNEIVQAPGVVAIRHEMIHETRVVYTDGRPPIPRSFRFWMGSSRGRWEGDTLVVETTNVGRFAPGVGVNGGGTRHSDAIRFTERFTRVADDTLHYSMTVDDPRTWTRPWTLEFPLRRDDGYGFYEYACHEGNYAMFHMLSGARADERAAAEAVGK